MVAEIAIVGMACRYPQANSPAELWENALSQRRAFRRIPQERLHLTDYFSSDRSVPDSTYSSQGAFIDNYEFDRVRFRISGNSYRASDLAHWLALDIASQALNDAGFILPEQLPLETTSVIVGNTLTGEFSRANGLRLRWPYVRRVVEAALRTEGWEQEHLEQFLGQLEASYKEPFAAVGEETLAGGLSNTIAGRICNYFNFKGGGYTVDGACSSSLLAVATACSALVNRDSDLALAGGVDLSIDPFELIGFAKTSALAQDEMRVYDVHSAGFLPGEGCGFVVLMRYEDALAQQRHVYALIRGWGISSDGAGGITRPDVEGQTLALKRAYDKAQVGSETIAYFEGHGTGTAFGDATELKTLSRLRRQSKRAVAPAVVGSIKANIGHTKAAAGIAGLIKATLAVSTQVLPPNTGVDDPQSELTGQDAVLQLLDTAKVWPAELPLRAGVSSMGFGGINAHIVIEGIAHHRRTTLTAKERLLSSSMQDAELFLLSGQDCADLKQQIDHLLTIAPRLSLSDMTDLSVHLASIRFDGRWRAAIIASRPAEMTERLEELQTLLVANVTKHIDAQAGIFLDEGYHSPRIGYLFPGQGAPSHLNGGLFRRRFDIVDTLYRQVNLPTEGNEGDTRIAQPAIITSSLAALRLLKQMGITAQVSLGHSLGELTALHWAGAMNEEMLIALARIRGEAMSTLGSPTGAMVSLKATQSQVEELFNDEHVVIAAINAPQQIVISGDAHAVNTVVEQARNRKIASIPLAVSHAFHSSLVAAAVQPFSEYLLSQRFQPLQHTVVSTVTGGYLDKQCDISALLCQQITSPVQFVAAVNQAAADVDLFIEVGPGKILSGLTAQSTQIPALSIDAGGRSVKDLLKVVGAAFALGVPIQDEVLFAHRFHRPFDLNWQPRFFVNPCELAPLPQGRIIPTHQETKLWQEDIPLETQNQTVQAISQDKELSAKDFIRQLIAQRVELPMATIKDDSRLLSDLHLNSITVGQVVSETWRAFQLLPPIVPTDYADATIIEIAQALEDTQKTGGMADLKEKMAIPSGVDMWVRSFEVAYIEAALPETVYSGQTGRWNILASADYPLQDALIHALAQVPGDGVVVCLAPSEKKQHLPLLLNGAQEWLKRSEATHFVLIQHNRGYASFARTLYLEAPKRTVCVIDLPLGHPQTVDWVTREVQRAHSYSEAVYSENGTRTVPYLQLLKTGASRYIPLPLGTDDVLLVTGGGKGIAAECAFSLAQKTGVHLLLLGRSNPDHDTLLSENLRRLASLNIRFEYTQADVTDKETVSNAIQQAEMKIGRVTAVLHGAGANVPRLISALSEADMLATLSPKVQGLHNVLASVDHKELKLLVTFGSVIARTGMRGEADYALANDWLALLTEEFGQLHSTCRCLCIEWSVWSGVGMGERLGKVEALMREGIQPIPVDDGISLLYELLEHDSTPVRVVVTSRFGETATLQMRQTNLPLLRFLEQPRVSYPGIELVVDITLSTNTDPYVEDHKYHGERLIPAVVGLEAMAQVAMAVTGQNTTPSFERAEFYRPVVIPERDTTVVRIAALVRKGGNVDVVLRCQDTAFQFNHFSTTCRFDRQDETSRLPDLPTFGEQNVDLDPARDLYGSILFHQRSFQRVSHYYVLQAKACLAEITPYTGKNWYAQYLPADSVLGNPAARDALIHCIQACIPHATLLPVGVEKIRIFDPSLHSNQKRFVAAKERWREGDIFHYDVEMRSATGELMEQWIDLRLQQVELLPEQKIWRSALLGPYIERKINDFFDQSTTLQVILQQSFASEQHTRSEMALYALAQQTTPIYRRADGKPILIEEPALLLSTSHIQTFTLAVTCSSPVGCDIEAITARSEYLWQDLLGEERYRLTTHLASQFDEDLTSIATRIWAASESLKKAGAMINVPLLFQRSKDAGWYLFTAGHFVIATYKTTVWELDDPIVLAICLRGQEE